MEVARKGQRERFSLGQNYNYNGQLSSGGKLPLPALLLGPTEKKKSTDKRTFAFFGLSGFEFFCQCAQR
jgi:hypothetical protein